MPIRYVIYQDTLNFTCKDENFLMSLLSSPQQLKLLYSSPSDEKKNLPFLNIFKYFKVFDCNFSHGLDIHYGDGSKYLHPLPEAQVDKANEVKKELNDICQDGAWIEDKGSSCTFHYRYALLVM